MILRGFRAVPYVVLTGFALLYIYPMFWMIANSFKDNEQILVTNPFGFPASLEWTNYINIMESYRIDMFFLNSVIVAAVTVPLTAMLAGMFAFAVARMKWKWSGIAFTYITMGLMIPVQVILIPLVLLVRDLQLYNTHLGLILPYTAFNLSFASMICYGFLRSVPKELEEAACIDGANIYRIFGSVVFPVIRPAVATASIFVFLSAWNEFPLALVLTSKPTAQTLPLGVLSFVGQHTVDWGALAAAMTIASLPTLIIYLFFSEFVEKSLTVGSAVK